MTVEVVILEGGSETVVEVTTTEVVIHEVPTTEVVEIEVARPGVNGLSAYEIAVEQGFVGTEAEWITSLGGSGSPTVLSVNTKTGSVVLNPDDLDDTATTNKFTSATEIAKLGGVAEGAEVNVNPDWNAVSGDAQVLNKPTLGTAAAQNVEAFDSAGSATAAQSAAEATAAGELATHAATATTHGVTGALVGTTDEQELSGKMITSLLNDVEADAIHIQVRNTTGATIAKGSPVYITGYNAGQERVTVGLASASSAATMPAIGITTSDILNNENGTIEVIGRLEGINTSLFSVGDELYVSETAGVLTATAPNTSSLVQKVGTVLRSHATLGVIDVGTEETATAYATAVVYGIVRYATNTEATTGTATDRALTPANGAAAFATATQGATADTAVQPGDLATVATTGSYNDLTSVPPRRIFETALGVWTADAPSGRTDFDVDTIEFVGVTDPSDATNGITTPANMVAGDRWTETVTFVT